MVLVLDDIALNIFWVTGGGRAGGRVFMNVEKVIGD